jgi:hypothetical protein
MTLNCLPDMLMKIIIEITGTWEKGEYIEK